MLHLDDIIELCLSLVRSEEKQNARPCVEWAAAASRASERTTLSSQDARRSWVGLLRPASSKDELVGMSQKPDPGSRPPPLRGAFSQTSPPEAVGTRGARRSGVRLETVRASPKRSLARARPWLGGERWGTKPLSPQI